MNYLRKNITARFLVFFSVIMLVFWLIPVNIASGEVQGGSESPTPPGTEQSATSDTTIETTTETTDEITAGTTAETATDTTTTETIAETTQAPGTTPPGTEQSVITETMVDISTTETATETTLSSDAAPPVITLKGDSSVTIKLGSTYVDTGATAADDVDGDLTSSIIVVNTVDTSAAGSYKVTYNVSDKAGNAATEVTRIVNVVAKPTVTTDKDDYSPGELVIVTGTGWLPGETVELSFYEIPLQLTVKYYTIADDNGNIYDNQYLIAEHHLGQTIILTATGQKSGSSAITIFTDSPQIGSVTVGNQSPNPVYPSYSAAYTITIYRGTGSSSFYADLSVATALPSGCTDSFSSAHIYFSSTATSKTSTLTISTISGTTPAGTMPFTVKAEVSGAPVDNATGSGTLVVESDMTAPAGLLNINSGAAAVNTTAATLNLSATDDIGVTGYRVANGSDASGAATVNVTSTKSYSANVSWTLPPGEGTKTVAVQYRDAAGNWSGNYTDIIILDVTAPATGSLNINSSAAATDTRSVTLNLSATDDIGVTGYRVANGSDASGAATINVTSTTSYSADISFTLSTGNGTKTVAVQYRDAAGNWSGNYTDTIILDTVKPTITLTPYAPDLTTDNTPSYSGTAADTLTNIVDIEYRIDSGGTFTDIDSFTPGTSVSFTFTTTALTDGNHTIYVRAYDEAGNVSSLDSDTLRVTVTSPTITSQPSSATKTVGESVTFSVIASGTAPLSYQWRKGGNIIPGATSSSYVISSVTIGDAGSYDVVVSNTFGSATSNLVTLTIIKAVTIISVTSATGTYGGTVNLSATLTSGGAPLSGKTVDFNLRGGSSVGTAVTNSSGVATLNNVSLAGINTGLYPGSVGSGVGASFAGDSNYNASSGAALLTVSPAPLTVTAGNASRLYGNPNPLFSGTISGIANSDNITA